LVAEAKQCETMVVDEVGKVKDEMETEVGQPKALIEKQSEQRSQKWRLGRSKSTQ
jgi:hypothetical protein